MSKDEKKGMQERGEVIWGKIKVPAESKKRSREMMKLDWLWKAALAIIVLSAIAHLVLNI